MRTTGDEIDGVTERIIGCAIEVHRQLGPGLLESVYQECLLVEMLGAGLQFEAERLLSLTYKGQVLSARLRVELVVAGYVIVEVKSVASLLAIHVAQVMRYLRLSGCPAGLLMNFNEVTLKAGLKRLRHPDLYPNRAFDLLRPP